MDALSAAGMAQRAGATRAGSEEAPVAACRWNSLRVLSAVAFAALLCACGTTSRPGGYYQDDGPPREVPPGLMSTPDATPRDEPLNAYANRPYRALGHTYTPETAQRPFHQQGLASWYGRQYHGNRTASGEKYDMFAMTAAHPTLPIPSYARVTNLRDGRSVVVRINDRGPFLYDRIIDLSYVAAVRLGVASRGEFPVSVDRILPAQIPAPVAAARSAPAPAAAAIATNPQEASAYPVSPAAGVALEATPLVASPPSAPAAQPLAPLSSTQRAIAEPLPPRGWSAQLGAFSLPANADALRDRCALLLGAPDAADLAPADRMPRVERDGELYRVLVGASPDRAGAVALVQRLSRILARDATLFQRP